MADTIGSRLLMAWLRFMKALYLSRMVAFSSGADFVGDAGGVYRSSDSGESWIEVNHDVIQTDVRALAINSNGHIFAGTYFGGGVFPSMATAGQR